MTNSYIVHLTAEPEPSALHGLADGQHVYGVQLSLQATGADEQEGKDASAAFLKDLVTSRFVLVDLATPNTAVAVTRRTPDPEDSPWVQEWLERAKEGMIELAKFRAETAPDDVPFFARPSGLDPLAANMQTASAFDLMRATAKWPAPLAQKAGLVSAVMTEEQITEGGEAVLVQVFDGETFVEVTKTGSSNIGDHQIAQLEVKLRKGGEELTRVQHATVLKTYNAGDMEDHGLEANGLFRLEGHSDEFARLLNRIEEQAPTLIWAATSLPVMALDPQFFATLAVHFDPDQVIDPDKLHGDAKASAEPLFWLKRAAATALLDVMVSGLLLPTHNPTPDPLNPGKVAVRQSSVLQRLSRRIASAYEDKIADDGLPPPFDEDQIYAALHEELWESLANLAPEEVLGQLEKMLPEGGIGTISEAFAGPDENPITWDKWQLEVEKLSQEISDLALALEGEEGGENWLIDRFDAAFETSPGAFKRLLIEKAGFTLPLPAPTGATPEEVSAAADWIVAARKPFDRAYADFKADIAGPFDAAEAVRRDFGEDLIAAVSMELPDGETGDLLGLLDKQDVFLQRFPLVAPAESLFGRLLSVCPPVTDGQLDQRSKEALADAFKRMSQSRMTQLLNTGQTAAVFRPDQAPQPLKLPLMKKLDPQEAHFIAENSSGLGFLVRGGFAESLNHSPDHVNLIRVMPPPKLHHGYPDTVTVEPTLPMPTPGSSSLYLPYEGQPVSSPSKSAPGAGGQPVPKAVEAALQKINGFVRGEAEVADGAEESDKDIKAPELSYGARYDVSAFWVPPSGVLPNGLHKGGSPFDPVKPKAPGTFCKENAQGFAYQRRTAIAETTLTLSDIAKPLAKGVHPLALDDPRLEVERLNGGRRHLDLYRNADGSGTLAGGTSGGDAAYALVFVREGDIPKPVDNRENLIVRGLDTGNLSLGQMIVTVMTGPETGHAATFDSTDGEYFSFEVASGAKAWLRLHFDGAISADSTGLIAFDDPSFERDQDSAGRTASLMVLAPDTKNWTEPNARSLSLKVPGVSFIDLERWASNTDLWVLTMGLSGVDARKNAQMALERLRGLHAFFEAWPSDDIRVYADKMNALPDPAVSGYLISAGVLDGVRRSALPQVGRSAQEWVAINPYGGLKFNDLADELSAIDLQDQKAVENKLNELKIEIDSILEAGRIDLEVQGALPGTSLAWQNVGPSSLTLQVPAGQIARFRATPGVKRTLFEQGAGPTVGIFDNRMKQLACGAYDDNLLFDGAKLTLEVMQTVQTEHLAHPPIAARLKGHARSYLVESNLGADQRIFSQLELVTQRWRPSGMPIYSYFDPVPLGEKSDGPVVVVDGMTKTATLNHIAGSDAVSQFEKEAFVGWDASDGERTQVRLSPAPDSTELWRFDWPESAATYLRHSAVLKSRYAAAYRKEDQFRTTGDLSGSPFILRVVILADVTGPELTRPQLRAHLPIQRRIDRDSLAPPIACVLNEVPHAQLGLADRVFAEIVTTNVFEIPAGGSGRKLGLKNLRKEIGPDPMISYFPVPDKRSLGCRIAVEGPVGLHFDAPQVSTPAFVNSQYLLHLSLKDSDDLSSEAAAEIEESFVGLSLSRYSDPGWTWQPTGALSDRESTTEKPHILKEDIWLTPRAGFSLKVEGHEILKVKNAGFQASRTAVWEDGGAGQTEVAAAEDVAALLIKPIDDARIRVSFFGHDDQGRTGRNNRPAPLSSLILRTKGEVQVLDAQDICRVRQSPTTFAKWVRTGRDMDEFVQIDATGEDRQILVKDLEARIESNLISLDQKPVASPVARRRYPLHVHRRLVHLLRRPAPELGAPVALFDQALLADGTGRAVPASQGGNPNPDAESLVVAEAEMRAAILRIQKPGEAFVENLVQYDTARLDLLGSRTKHRGTQSGDRHLRFHIRGANAPIALSGFVMKFAIFDTTTPPAPDLRETNTMISGEIVLPDIGIVSALALDLMICTVSQSDDLRAYVRSEDGRIIKVSDFQHGVGFASALEGGETIEISLENNDPNEGWVDVSLLQSAKAFDPQRPDDFDFDWVFSNTDPNVPDDLNPDVLNMLPEGQMRIVGLTESIPIRS